MSICWDGEPGIPSRTSRGRSETACAERPVPGNPLVSPILERIDESPFVIADITYLNLNVVYEIGFTIGRCKRAFLVRHLGTDGDKDISNAVGIFDTLGYHEYENSEEPQVDRLAAHIASTHLTVSTALNRNSGLPDRAIRIAGDRRGSYGLPRSLIPFVQTTVAPGATVRTDGWSAYSGLANQGYDHQPRSISASGDPAHIVMPRVHRVAALLDRWWLGIHHGAIDADHLDYYLDEFTFRFNRRRSQARGLLFFRLLQQAVQHEPVPYKGLVGGHRSLGNQM